MNYPVQENPASDETLVMLDVREKFCTALMAISDPGRSIDGGLGGGGADLWVTVDGVEYFVSIKPSNAQRLTPSQHAN